MASCWGISFAVITEPHGLLPVSVSNSLFKVTVQIYICGLIFLDVSTFLLMFFSFPFSQLKQLSFLFFVLGEIINSSGMEGRKNCQPNISLLDF